MDTIETKLERSILQRIPQTRNLGIQIAKIEENQLTVNGAFAPNKNHLDIVFGGSIAAISITTAWALVQHKVEQAGLAGHLVIKRQQVDYLLPVKTDFSCEACFLSEDAWAEFVDTYQAKGRARITVTAQVLSEGKTTSRFEGVFVLFKPA